MWERCSIAQGGSGGAGAVELRNVWEVDADAAYDVRRGGDSGRGGLIAAYTFAGLGDMEFFKRPPTSLAPGSLVVVESAAVKRYRAVADRWHFWWFDFHAHGTLPLPLWRPLDLPGEAAAEDKLALEEVMGHLRRDDQRQRAYASARFNAMLHRWAMIWGGAAAAGSSHRAAVDGVIDAMHDNLRKTLTISYMSSIAGMSERHFRLVFHRLTGRSPKQFYDHLRVNTAREMLRAGVYNVGEVSDRVGFCNQFHFSRVFKRITGLPPSAATK